MHSDDRQLLEPSHRSRAHRGSGYCVLLCKHHRAQLAVRARQIAHILLVLTQLGEQGLSVSNPVGNLFAQPGQAGIDLLQCGLMSGERARRLVWLWLSRAPGIGVQACGGNDTAQGLQTDHNRPDGSGWITR